MNKEEPTGDVLTGSNLNYSTLRQNGLRSKDKWVKRKKIAELDSLETSGEQILACWNCACWDVMKVWPEEKKRPWRAGWFSMFTSSKHRMIHADKVESLLGKAECQESWAGSPCLSSNVGRKCKGCGDKDWPPGGPQR